MTANARLPLTPCFPAITSVKIIGLGGVGSLVAEYAALWLNAQATVHEDIDFRLVLIDGDAFESSNARTFFTRHGNKAAVKREELIDRLDERLQRLMITAVEEYVTPDNVGRLLRDGDFVLLCVDSHASRKLVSDHFARTVRDGVLISAGNDGVGRDPVSGRTTRGTFGTCQIFVRRNGADRTPSLSAFHEEIANPKDALPTEQHCTELITTVPQLLFANIWAGAAILSTFYLSLCGEDAMSYQELAFDLALGMMTPHELRPAPI